MMVDLGSEFFDLVYRLENADISASSDEITKCLDARMSRSGRNDLVYAAASDLLQRSNTIRLRILQKLT